MVADAITLIQLSDCHLPGDRASRLRGVDTDATMAAVLDHALGVRGPDAILATGDLANEGSPEAYRRINTLFRKVGVPVLCLPGNHDIAEAFGREFTGENIDILGARRFENWQIVLLDSTVAGWEDGCLGAAELNRLDSELHRYPHHHALICLHHNPVPVGGGWRDHVALRDAADFFRITASHRQIRGLLWGPYPPGLRGDTGRCALIRHTFHMFSILPGRRRPHHVRRPARIPIASSIRDGSIESEAIFLTRK